MLPAHLCHRHLHHLRDLARRTMRTVGAVGQPAQLAGEIPRYPPVQRGPVHSHPGRYFHDISAIQDRADRIQALLNQRQDDQCQSRPPQSRRPAETSHQSGRNTATVAHLLAEECRTSVAGGHNTRCRSGDNYLYVFKGARSAPRAYGATSPRESATWQGNLVTYGVAWRTGALRPQGSPPWCGHSALAPVAHGGVASGGSPRHWPVPVLIATFSPGAPLRGR